MGKLCVVSNGGIMKKRLLVLFLISLFCVVFNVHSSVTTHALGDTGYMIREAMWAKANKFDPENYWQAVKLQSQAKKYFRGKIKGGRNLSKAMELTKQAYNLAKQARDKGLVALHQKVAQ